MNKYSAIALLDGKINELLFAVGGIEDCDSISVRFLTGEDWDFRPQHNSWTGSATGTNDCQRVHLVLADGKILKDEVSQKGRHGSNYAHTDDRHEEGESIQDALYRNKLLTRDVLAVVMVHSGYEIVDHYSQNSWRAEIWVRQ